MGIGVKGARAARRAGLRIAAAWLAAGLIASGPAAHAQEKFIVMASTTSTENSGLFKHLLPAFQAATGIAVRVVAVGTGEALDTGRRGDVRRQAADERLTELGAAPGTDAAVDKHVLMGKRDPADEVIAVGHVLKDDLGEMGGGPRDLGMCPGYGAGNRALASGIQQSGCSGTGVGRHDIVASSGDAATTGEYT